MGKGYSPVVEQKIITQLNRGVKAPRNIAKQAHLNASTVRVALSKMARAGQVRRLPDGSGYVLRRRTQHTIHSVPARQPAASGMIQRPDGGILGQGPKPVYPWPPAEYPKPVSRKVKVVIGLVIVAVVLIWVF